MHDVSEGFDDLMAQVSLLLDRERVSAFARALRECVGPSDVVADLGTGNGILAVLAAKAGARKVYAIERGGIADLAQRIFQINGVSDRIELLRGDARDVVFPEPPTLVVSETMGSWGIEEDIAALLKLMRPRCTPDVRFMPSTLELLLAPVSDERLEQELRDLEEVEGVSLAPLRARVVQRPTMMRLHPDRLMGPPARAALLELSRDALPAVYRAKLRVDRPCRVNVLGGWFSVTLSPSVTLHTAPGAGMPSWGHLNLPLDPPLSLDPSMTLDVEVEPRLVGGRALTRWSAVASGGERRDGDVLASSGGSLRDFAQQLGLGLISGDRKVGSKRFEAWAAALGGDPNLSIDAMAARVLAAMPGRYAGMEDAREEVVRLLDACDAMG